ncbi:peptidoglycan DD-metalloendopeptidase family protein [Candidatus Peregrinibacteria bacterium]|nr:peptidoglycan DD-metalloendopeptidase family protein [Candidatus Peregrinibacteria bacterium]
MKGFKNFIKRHISQFVHDFRSSKHTLSWVVIIAMLAMSVVGVEYTQLNLQSSVLTLEMPQDFDGTVYPLYQTPKWHELTSDEYRLAYSDLPQGKMRDMPRYNPNTLQASLTDLGYSEGENEVRDAKITYSVAYLGNYELDGVEYAGSHPAVDIKAPAGTPVLSIANGIVTKIADQAYGFGLHVVVKHLNVPTEDGKTQTLYSSYSHMERIDIAEGDTVEKGEQIGTVGSTGTSTVDHLHFQLDRGGSDSDPDIESAPWHPYWPFTYNDYSSQGLSFFDAINQGIGQENAIQYTMNPMTFVQSNLVTGAVIKLTSANVVEEEVIEEVGEVVEEVPVVEEEISEPENVEIEDSQEEPSTVVDVEETPEESTEVVEETPAEEEEVIIEEEITEEDDTETEDSQEGDADAPLIEEIPNVEAVPTKPEYQLVFDHKDVYLVGNLMEFELTIKDMDGNIAEEAFFSDAIMLSSTDSNIIELETKTIRRDDFENGVAVAKVRAVEPGEFKLRLPFGDTIYASNPVTIREDVKEIHGFEIKHDGHFALEEAEILTVVPIDDNGDQTAFTILGDVKVEIIEGDAELDKPTLTMADFGEGIAYIEVTPTTEENIVVKAQHSFIKGQSDPLKLGAPLFSDLSENHENYEAIYKLKMRDVISGYPDGTFKPNKGVSRVEALKLIFAGLEAVVPDPDTLRFMLEDLFPDQWYAPYVAHAITQGVVKGYPDGMFRPAQTVNKAEFAKMLVLGLNIDIDLEVAPDSSIIGSDVRPSDWFYLYVSFLIENGIVDLIDNKFNPAEPMDRAKVAEAIWRVVKSQ